MILRLIGQAGREKFADQQRSGILSGLLGKTLGQRKNVALGKIEFQSLDAMHGEEEDAGSERLSVADLDDEVVERGEFDAAQAESYGREMENRTPEFFAWVSERGDDDGSGTKGRGRLRGLIEAGAGHEGIVVWVAGKLQPEKARRYDPGPTTDYSDRKIFDLE